MKSPAVCSFCGSISHNSIRCYKKQIASLRDKPHKKKKPIRKEIPIANNKRQLLKTTFFANNPPDEKGGYTCYLQISPHCLKWISKPYVTIEHVYPRQKFPELKYIPENILPSCEFCNKTKMSNTPEQLAIFFPNIKVMLETKEWLKFMNKLRSAIEERHIRLYWFEDDKVFRRYEPEK